MIHAMVFLLHDKVCFNSSVFVFEKQITEYIFGLSDLFPSAQFILFLKLICSLEQV